MVMTAAGTGLGERDVLEVFFAKLARPDDDPCLGLLFGHQPCGNCQRPDADFRLCCFHLNVFHRPSSAFSLSRCQYRHSRNFLPMKLAIWTSVASIPMRTARVMRSLPSNPTEGTCLRYFSGSAYHNCVVDRSMK